MLSFRNGIAVCTANCYNPSILADYGYVVLGLKVEKRWVIRARSVYLLFNIPIPRKSIATTFEQL